MVRAADVRELSSTYLYIRFPAGRVRCRRAWSDMSSRPRPMQVLTMDSASRAPCCALQAAVRLLHAAQFCFQLETALFAVTFGLTTGHLFSARTMPDCIENSLAESSACLHAYLVLGPSLREPSHTFALASTYPSHWMTSLQSCNNLTSQIRPECRCAGWKKRYFLPKRKGYVAVAIANASTIRYVTEVSTLPQ